MSTGKGSFLRKVWDALSSSTGKEQTPREMCLPSVKDAVLGRMVRNAVET